MGRIITPPYRVEYRDNLLAMGKTVADMAGKCGKPVLTMIWNVHDRYNGNVKGYGTPTLANLTKWRETMNNSYKKDGSNYHITQHFNMIPHIHYAAIVRQSDGKVMCEFRAPLFEAA